MSSGTHSCTRKRNTQKQTPSLIKFILAWSLIPFFLVSWIYGLHFVDPYFDTILTGVLYFLALLTFPFTPSPCSILMLINYTISAILPNTFAEYYALGTFLSIAYISYHYKTQLSITLILISELLYDVAVAIYSPTDFPLIFSNISFYLISFICGYSIRRMTQRHVEERTRLRNDYAQSLHDAVSSELTSIALLAQQGLEEEDHELIFNTLEQQAGSALENVHTIITSLIKNTPTQQSILLIDAIKKGDRRLQQLGYTGKSIISDINITHSQAISSQLLSEIIREIYTNITRHCHPDHKTYILQIKVEDDVIIIKQSNPISKSSETLYSGYGLSLIRQMIQDNGGTLSYSREKEWNITIMVPLYNSAV